MRRRPIVIVGRRHRRHVPSRPSTRSGSGVVADLNVTLRVRQPATSASSWRDPGRREVVVLAGSGPLGGVDLTFDDEAAGRPPPATGRCSPAPTGRRRRCPPSTGAPAAGQWTLHVTDRGSGGGTVAGGWSLAVTALRAVTARRGPRQRRLVPARLALHRRAHHPPHLWQPAPDAPVRRLGRRRYRDRRAPSSGASFHLSNADGGPPTTFTFGDERGFAVAGDFDGDGRDDVAVYRDGTWQIRHGPTAPWPWPRSARARGPAPSPWPAIGTATAPTASAPGRPARGASATTPPATAPPTTTFALGPASAAYPVRRPLGRHRRRPRRPRLRPGLDMDRVLGRPLRPGRPTTRCSRPSTYGQPGDLPARRPRSLQLATRTPPQGSGHLPGGQSSPR